MASVLVHPWDAPLDDDECWTFLSAQGFGHLIAPGGREVPVVVPTQYVVDNSPGGKAEVLLHPARPNPIWQALDENSTVLLRRLDAT